MVSLKTLDLNWGTKYVIYLYERVKFPSRVYQQAKMRSNTIAAFKFL